MKIQKFIVLSAFMGLAVVPAHAQDASQQVKVKVKDTKLEQQMTPDYLPRGVTEKRWRPKQWLELDTELDVDVARDLGGKEGVYPALEIKYFIGVSGKTKEGKAIVLTGSITFENVPASKPGEENHALAYITPSTLKKALQKDNGGKSDVLAIGLEVHAGGQPIAVYSNKGAAWWIDANKQPDSTKFEFQGGAVIPKNKTPFAPLWADYDLQSKSE
jgi:hypothetical protein